MSRLAHGERGVLLLPLVLVVLTVGSLLLVPWLGFVRTGIGSVRATTQEELAYYAADAAVQVVLRDLRQGTDALAPSYVPPSVAVNDMTASVTVEAPPREDALPLGAILADPHSGTDLSPLPHDSDFLYEIQDVRPFTSIHVNWVFTPSTKEWELTLFEGSGTGGTQVAQSSGDASPATLTVGATVVSGGTYTVRFSNKSNTAVTAAPFGTTGESDKTWVRVTAFKDYVIRSSAESVALVVFARQSPGPTQDQRSVLIATWLGPG